VLRTNLSTRPFYAERAVHLVLGLLALVVIAVSAWQVSRVVKLSRYRTDLNTSVGRDRSEAADLTRKAAEIRHGMNQQELKLVATEAKEANNLIDKRTFSWTALFNQLESTLPADVMLVSLRPEVKDGRTHITMEIQGRRSEDVIEFFDRLEQSGTFSEVTWRAENVTEEGLHRVQMQADYAPQRSGRS